MSTVWRQQTYFDACATAAAVAIFAVSFLGVQTYGIDILAAIGVPSWTVGLN